MKILLSPTKKQITDVHYTKKYIPAFADRATILFNLLKSLRSDELGKLLKISNKLLEENLLRIKNWKIDCDLGSCSEAIFTYIGDSFQYLDPKSFSEDDLNYANKQLRIFSGLYGLLKPLDVIMPYRLDIKDTLKVPGYNNLYDFWSSDITEYLNQEFKNDNTKLLLNLSSKEYSKTVNFSDLHVKIITPEFKTMINGELKTTSIWSKRMRGLMAREVIKNKINTEIGIKSINFDDYELAEIQDGSYLYVSKQGLNYRTNGSDE